MADMMKRMAAMKRVLRRPYFRAAQPALTAPMILPNTTLDTTSQFELVTIRSNHGLDQLRQR